MVSMWHPSLRLAVANVTYSYLFVEQESVETDARYQQVVIIFTISNLALEEAIMSRKTEDTE